MMFEASEFEAINVTSCVAEFVGVPDSIPVLGFRLSHPGAFKSSKESAGLLVWISYSNGMVAAAVVVSTEIMVKTGPTSPNPLS